MNKKLMVSVVACLLMVASGGLAQEKVRVLEYLNWVQTGFEENILYTELVDPYTPYPFDTGTFMTVQVPPSPKAEALFFEWWGQSLVVWYSGTSGQSFSAQVTMRIVSNLIPAGVSVYLIHGIAGISGIVHFDDVGWDRTKRNWKFILRRNSMLRQYPDWWFVKYADGSGDVPSDQAQIILNDLIDNGFSVEISVSGEARGVKRFQFYAFAAEVTRLVKK